MKKLWIILGSVFGLLCLVVGLYFLEESYTEAILHGSKTINARVNEEYNDLGFDLFHNNKMLEKESYNVDKKDNVNTNILGKIA